MIYIFGFSIKGSVMYTCAVDMAKKNAQVIQLIGTPIKADTFAWISNYESSGSDEEGHFSTQLSGPKGSGTLDVYGSHDRRSTDLDIVLIMARRCRSIPARRSVNNSVRSRASFYTRGTRRIWKSALQCVR